MNAQKMNLRSIWNQTNLQGVNAVARNDLYKRVAECPVYR